MTNKEAIEKFEKIKRGNIFLIHQRIEGKEVIEDYSLCDMAISALQAQELSKNSPKLDKENGDLQPTCNQLATDTISRQAAIDRINKQREHLQPDIYPQDKIGDAAYRICAEFIERLPSTQPKSEERTAESAQNVPKEDLISRKEAIDALWEIRQKEISDGRRFHDYCSLSTAVDVIKDLPSAQPEPCEDAISRQAAIDALVKAIRKDPYYDSNEAINGLGVCDVRVILNDLPSAQPVPQWIPVSERLPEKYGNYLISIHGEDEPDIGTISPNDKRGWSLCDANGFHWASDKKLIVTAWMPLPEPYRAERRTDETD